MNREEYMKQLKKELKKLPKADFEKAIAYFKEYFDEAGAENETQAIEDLGTPQEAADQIIRDIVGSNTNELSTDINQGASKWKKIIAASCILIGIGILLCGIGMFPRKNEMGNSIFSPNAEEKRVHSYRSGEENLQAFQNMKLEANYCDVTIQPSDHYGISYHIDERDEFTYAVENGTLTVSQKCPNTITYRNTSFSIGNFEFNNNNVYTDYSFYEREYITIYIQQNSKFDDTTLVCDSGDVTCSELASEKLYLEAEYGKVTLAQIESKDAQIILNSGDLYLTAFADGNLKIHDEYGQVILQDVQAGDLYVKADSGNLEAKEVNADTLTVEDEYGDVVLDMVETDKTDLSADSGKISLGNLKTGECLAHSEYGNIDVKTMKADAVSFTADSGNISCEDVEAKSITVNSEYGNVEGNKIQTDSLSGEISSGSCKMNQLDVKVVNLKSEYGNVELDLVRKNTDYSYDLKTEYGKILINKEDMEEKYKTLEKRDKQITVFCESGNVEITGEK